MSLEDVNTLVNDIQKELILMNTNTTPIQETVIEEAVKTLDDWRDKHIRRLRRAFNG